MIGEVSAAQFIQLKINAAPLKVLVDQPWEINCDGGVLLYEHHTRIQVKAITRPAETVTSPNEIAIANPVDARTKTNGQATGPRDIIDCAKTSGIDVGHRKRYARIWRNKVGRIFWS